MYCWNCGKEVREGDTFCSNCGASLKRTSSDTTKSQVPPSSPRTPPPHPSDDPAPKPNNTAGASAGNNTKKESSLGIALFYLAFGAIMIYLGIDNARDMASGGIYTVVLGILPAHYLLYPLGGISTLAGLAFLFKG